MSDYLVNQIRATPNIDVRISTDIIGGDGRDRLEHITVRDKARNVVDSVPAELLFALIGATPQTNWLDGIVQRDAKGFIRTGHDVDLDAFPPSREPMSFETSVPGCSRPATSVLVQPSASLLRLARAQGQCRIFTNTSRKG
jgi:thioredoxin reductase (NADPH)